MAIHDVAIMSVSGTPGTGTITLNAAVDGGQTFAAAGAVDQERVPYGIIDGTDRESGWGLYTASGTTLTRNLVGSTTGSLLSLTSAARVFITPNADEFNYTFNASLSDVFGTGQDGDATITSNITLVRDMHYRNLTISGASGQITTAGFRVYASDTLTMTAAVAGAFRWNGNSGSNASSQSGGGGIAGVTGVTMGGSAIAGSGATGVVGAGAQAAAAAAAAANLGGRPGDGGLGGSGNAGANAGGVRRIGSAIAADLRYNPPQSTFMRSSAMVNGGGSGPGGSSGGGDGTNLGRGGGGGGSGAGCIFISARRIVVGGSTAAGAIQAFGGPGGSGGASVAGNAGGGAGGSGAGGGYVHLNYAERTGPTVVGMINVAGGAGGAGSAGLGTGIGGEGGRGGDRGRVQINNLTTGVYTEALAPSAAIGAQAVAPTTTAGTSGTAGVTGAVDF